MYNRLSLLAAALLLTPELLAAEPLVIAEPECAGISGLRPFWDRPVVLREDGATMELNRGDLLKGTAAIWAKDLDWHNGYCQYMEVVDPNYKVKPWDQSPGAIAFDAVHRSLLVRFPGCAQKIADEIAKGRSVVKLELLLPFRTAELMSIGYEAPSSFVGDMWDKQVPHWHAQAWRLRRPWKADNAMGPTYNDSCKGKVSWAKYGAQDEKSDRFPKFFGPVEVSQDKSEAIDVTASLADPSFGADLPTRLRGLEDCGFLVRKVEYYDMHFETPGYEWAAMTGGRAILVKAPQLRVTFADGKAEKIDLPKPMDPASGGEYKPTAVLPDDAEFAKLRDTYSFRKPDWMPDWQWKRVQELYGLGGHANAFPPERREYLKWIDDVLRTPPRTWHGFEAADQLALVYDFSKAFPQPVVDHLKLYWESWLMPERDTSDCVHNQYHQIWTQWRPLGSDYVDRTNDWRGNKSFYRESYCRYMSTMNFNHTAAIGALLGGELIGCERAIADGRYGLEMFPLRLWAWYDGTTQESIDHYYLAITMTDQKAFADYSPTAFDRLMGRSILWKTMEELADCYHPGLKRYVSTGGRTTPFYATQVQDGVQHIAHVMTKNGALTDLDKIQSREQEMRSKAVNKPPIIGHDLPPRRVAMQALKSPWAPDWLSEIFENKPLPFEMTATFRQWGSFLKEPKWKKSWLGQNYGVASYDFCTSPTINLQALWKRTPEPITSASDLGQLLIRFGYNRTNFIDTMKGGTLGNMGGSIAVLQHKGKMLVACSPNEDLKGSHFDPAKAEIKSLQTSICLFTLQDKPTWNIWIDGKEVSALPANAKAGSRIVVQDGVSFIGVVPLTATDLGRDVEVLIKEGGEPVAPQTGELDRESLLIESYFYRRDAKLDLAVNKQAIDDAFGGFVVETGDVAEYKDLAAFQKHMDDLQIGQKMENEVVSLSCKSGDDLLEMGFKPRGADSDGNQPASTWIPYRRVNGKWPYLAEGVERETPLSILGRKGKLEKNGAVLTMEPDQMGYIVTEPKTGTYMAANPLPDATWFRFEVKDGPTIEADGRIGLGFFTVQPTAGKLDILYGIHPTQPAEGLGSCLVVSGMAKKPEVVLNGSPLAKPVAALKIGGKDAWIIPLDDKADTAKVTETAITAARAEAAKAFAAGPGSMAKLVYEKGEHYLLTKPSVGAWSFQRQWPLGVAFRAETPEGAVVTADGRLAFLQLVINSKAGRVELFAPKYLYDAQGSQAYTDKATALLIAGCGEKPSVVINGHEVPGPFAKKTLGGKEYLVVPLYGLKPADNLEKTYAGAMKLLEGR